MGFTWFFVGKSNLFSWLILNMNNTYQHIEIYRYIAIFCYESLFFLLLLIGSLSIDFNDKADDLWIKILSDDR